MENSLQETSELNTKSTFVPVTGGELKWDKVIAGNLPEDALIGGFECEPIYVARAWHEDHMCPGKYLRSKNRAFIPCGCREHPKADFEILCGFDAQWVKTSRSQIPNNAFIAGYGKNHGIEVPLYVGRALHRDHLLIGKVYVPHQTCYLPYEGKEISAISYEILVTGD